MQRGPSELRGLLFEICGKFFEKEGENWKFFYPHVYVCFLLIFFSGYFAKHV
jgi:hypothetical protein